VAVSGITQIVSEGHVHYLDAFAAGGVLYAAWTEPISIVGASRLLRWRNQAGVVGTEITASLVATFFRFTVLPVASQNALLVVWQSDDSVDPGLYTARFDLTTGVLLSGPTLLDKGMRPRLVERPNGGTDLDPILALVDATTFAVYLRASWDGGVTWEGRRPVLNQMARDTIDLAAVAFDSGHVSIAQLASDARRLREVGSYSRTRPVVALAKHPTAADRVLAVEASARDVLGVAQLADTVRGALEFNGTTEVIVPTRKRLGTDDTVNDLMLLDVSGGAPALVSSLAIPAGAVVGDGVCRVALPGLTVTATVSPIFNGSAAPNVAPVALCVNGTTLIIAGYSDTADAGILALMDLGTNALTYTSVTGLARALGCDPRLAAVGRSSPASAGHALLFGANAAGITTYTHKLPARPSAILVSMETAASGQVFVGLADRLNVYQIDALNRPVRLVMSIPIFTRGAIMQIVMMPNGNLLCAMGEGGVAVISTTGEILAQTLVSGIYAAPWTRSTVYDLGATVAPTLAHAYAGQRRYFRCTTGGTSGAAEPAWSSPGTVSDGSAVWTEVGPTAGIVCGVAFDATRRRIYAAGVLGGTSGLAGRVWALDTEGLFGIAA
jgi:hypothetical protein